MVRGGLPDKIMNVYFIRDGNGVLAYDAGIRSMTKGIAAAAASLGGLTRVVLGHAHADHRGGAAGLAVPVYCHPDEIANAEGDGGAHTFQLEHLNRRNRALFKLAARFFDGGPVQIADTVCEDDQIAGFRVVHLPGHTPGQIGLWRSTDGLGPGQRLLLHIGPLHPRKWASARARLCLQPRPRRRSRLYPQARGPPANFGLARPCSASDRRCPCPARSSSRNYIAARERPARGGCGCRETTHAERSFRPLTGRKRHSPAHSI